MFGNRAIGVRCFTAAALFTVMFPAMPALATETALAGSEINSLNRPAAVPDQPVRQDNDVLFGGSDRGLEAQERTTRKKRSAITFDTLGGNLAPLAGVKVLGWKNPGTRQAAGFDLTVEFHGLGVQFEEQGAYGYMRADRAFSGENRVGVRFRFRY